jgi:hypothetical protein
MSRAEEEGGGEAANVEFNPIPNANPAQAAQQNRDQEIQADQ